jgi:uncharacterized protein DUF2817
MSYFSEDYFIARDRFRRNAAQAGGRALVLQISAKGPRGEDLTIDVAWFGSESPRRVLVHSSGLHGVEGFAGSAIQLQLLDHLPAIPIDMALILVHVLNPFGMSWLRRVNENNVDLNRNFRGDESRSMTAATYSRLDGFLNPRSGPHSDSFYLKAITLILRHGMAPLKQAIVGGQYDFPKGLFFGGTRMEEGPRLYETFLSEHVALVDRAVVIDVHTGVGRYAEDLVLVEAEDCDRLRNRFGPRVTPLEPDKGAAYRVEGGLQSMIFRVFSKTRPIFVGQEFGTYNPIKVLHALREENRWHHFGGASLEHGTKRAIKETFCPADEVWRKAVLERGQELISQAMTEFV